MKQSNFHPVDLVGHDVIDRLRKLRAGYEVEYYVLEMTWKIWDAAQHRMHFTAFGVGLLAFCAGFGICWFVFVR